MGSCASSSSKVMHDSEMDMRIAKILGARAKKMQERRAEGCVSKGGLHSFEQFVVSFAAIKKNFLKIKNVYSKFDANGDGLIQLEELVTVLSALGATCSQEEVNDIFTTSVRSADSNSPTNGLTFKEFLVSIATGYLLGLIPQGGVRKMTGEAKSMAADIKKAEDEGVPEIVLAKRRKANDPTAAFNKVVDAFLYFDKNGDGFIEKEEMRAILSEDESGDYSTRRSSKPGSVGGGNSGRKSSRSGSSSGVSFASTPDKKEGRKGSGGGSGGGSGSKKRKGSGADSGGMAAQFLTGSRWEEIDWDKDGKITFKEFLLAVSGWVGLGEGGEEED